MEALQIMPIMAQNQSKFNLGEYAEEAPLSKTNQPYSRASTFWKPTPMQSLWTSLQTNALFQLGLTKN